MAITPTTHEEAISSPTISRPAGEGTNGGIPSRVGVLLVSPMITPYRNPLFNVLARSPGIRLQVIHLCRRHRREWGLHLDEIDYPFSILTHGGLHHESLSWGGLLPRRMARESFEVAIVPGYSHPAYVQAILLGRAMGKKVVLWSESTALDRRSGGKVREFLKRRIVRLCDEYLTCGSAGREYLERLGAPPGRIHTVPNVVDTEFFRRSSRRYAGDREAWRRKLGLPGKVILFVGRLVERKGVGDLLSAYAGLEGRDDVGLILVGSGPGLQGLRRRATGRRWRGVFLPGFVPKERLPLYYALADVFVLPTWTDPWGLVVNEAMASGLPVIVSDRAGCSRDLVRHGENGLTVPARDVVRLRSALRTLLERPDLRARMGKASSRIIAGFTPEESGRAMADAVLRIARGTPPRPGVVP